jgi:hypothetical protein
VSLGNESLETRDHRKKAKGPEARRLEAEAEEIC